MNVSRPLYREPTAIGFSGAVRVLLFVGGSVLGLALGYFIPLIAKWALTLPWVPYEGPLKLITSVSGLWATVIASLLGLAAGLWFAQEVIKDTLYVVVSGETIRLEKDGAAQELTRETIGAVFLDGKQLVVLGNKGEELARETYEWASGRIAGALTEHGYPWSPGGDPYKEHFRRWVPDTPDLPPAVNALLKAREIALQKKEKGEAKELRREVSKLGFVVRDEGTRQYWRAQTTGS
ncbi:DUF308 domain-containing protein [Paenibacillus ehimensis]|uniref:YqeB family protein n=1 Tax=Paenibacillus ehimensis TaxID=79264 RepID=UPI003D28CDD6